MKAIQFTVLLVVFPAGVFGAEMTFDEIVKSVAPGCHCWLVQQCEGRTRLDKPTESHI